jgi:hypothetical protein
MKPSQNAHLIIEEELKEVLPPPTPATTPMSTQAVQPKPVAPQQLAAALQLQATP